MGDRSSHVAGIDRNFDTQLRAGRWEATGSGSKGLQLLDTYSQGVDTSAAQFGVWSGPLRKNIRCGRNQLVPISSLLRVVADLVHALFVI